MSRVRLPLWVWLSMVRVGFTLSLCDSVVAVHDLFASSVWESEACAQSARPEQRYAAIASSMSRVKRMAGNRRGRPSLHRRSTRADRPCPSRSGILTSSAHSRAPEYESHYVRVRAVSRERTRMQMMPLRLYCWMSTGRQIQPDGSSHQINSDLSKSGFKRSEQ